MLLVALRISDYRNDLLAGVLVVLAIVFYTYAAKLHWRPNKMTEQNDKGKEEKGSRSVSFGNDAVLKNSPITLGDNGPITINPKRNPYAEHTQVTYNFHGDFRIMKEGPGGKESINIGSNRHIVDQIMELYKKKDWAALLRLCESQMKESPLWPTPHLFAGIASLNLGQKDKGISHLQHVENETAGNSQWADASRILNELRKQYNR